VANADRATRLQGPHQERGGSPDSSRNYLQQNVASGRTEETIGVKLKRGRKSEEENRKKIKAEAKRRKGKT